ncbi:transposase [Salinimicrobium xinjiangense]|uniref:transposase n=1 Tax=Salinimicrobium xinjiangense TaxID=438596 RepID=UPI00048D5A26|nr:transposase [Salinimicrobium xinjiangense]
MKLETLEKDSVYHLYNRGINRSNIFSNEENKFYFLKQYNKYLSGKVSTFAYCLLQNHFHLVVRIEGETKEVTQCFSNFFNSYAKAYNKLENRSGSLFEKHFKRIKVNKESYLKQLIIYVNLNPQIHFGEDFKDYSFSSYKEILKESSKIIKSDEIFELFGGKKNFEEVHDIRKISLSDQLTLE